VRRAWSGKGKGDGQAPSTGSLTTSFPRESGVPICEADKRKWPAEGRDTKQRAGRNQGKKREQGELSRRQGVIGWAIGKKVTDWGRKTASGLARAGFRISPKRPSSGGKLRPGIF